VTAICEIVPLHFYRRNEKRYKKLKYTQYLGVISLVPQRSFSSVGIFVKQRERRSIPVSAEVYFGFRVAVGFSSDGDQFNTIEDVDGTTAYW